LAASAGIEPRRPSRPGGRAFGGRLLLLALVVALLAAPASAQAAFTFAGTLSGAGQDASGPQVGIDSDGDAAFVWSRFDGTDSRVQARFRSAAGTLGVVQNLSPAGKNARYPQVAVAPNGAAVFVWESPDESGQCDFDGCNRIQTRVRSASGTLSAVQTLTNAGQEAVKPQVGVDSDGDAVFVWLNDTTRRIQTRARSATGTLSAVQDLSPPSTPNQGTLFPDIAVVPNGNAVFVWQREDATTQCGLSGSRGCRRIQTRARAAPGTLSTVQTLSVAGQDAEFPHVGVDSVGNAVFVWQRPDGTTQCPSDGIPGCMRIQTMARTAGGTLSAGQTLSVAGRNAIIPDLGVDSDGDAVFVWSIPDGTTTCGSGPGCQRVQTRARSKTAVLSTAQILSAAGQSAGVADVAVEPDGDAAFVWQRQDGTHPDSPVCCSRIQTASRSAAGALSGGQTLSGAGENALNARIAVAPNGAAAAVWLRWDGSAQCSFDGCIRAQAATRPPT
jgi:hypothetical protein